jgi:hypothetical protein
LVISSAFVTGAALRHAFLKIVSHFPSSFVHNFGTKPVARRVFQITRVDFFARLGALHQAFDLMSSRLLMIVLNRKPEETAASDPKMAENVTPLKHDQ